MLPLACSSVINVIGGDLQRILLEESFILLLVFEDCDVFEFPRLTEELRLSAPLLLQLK